MESGFRKVQLGDEGRAFLASQFKGLRGLRGKLEARLGTGFDYFTYLPTSHPIEMAFNFEWGGLMYGDNSSARKRFEQHYSDLSRNRKKGVLIIQDGFIYPDDTRYFPFHKFQLHSADSVYFYVPHYAMSAKQIWNVEDETAMMHLAGAYADIEDSELQFLVSRNAVDELLERIAATAVEVFTDAYDFEGFVYCRLHG